MQRSINRGEREENVSSEELKKDLSQSIEKHQFAEEAKPLDEVLSIIITPPPVNSNNVIIIDPTTPLGAPVDEMVSLNHHTRTSKVDLLDYQSLMTGEKLPRSKDTLFAMGDGHGNFFKVLATLLTHTHLIDIKEEDYLTVATIYSNYLKLPPPRDFTQTELEELRDIIYNKLVIDPNAVGKVIFIGDILSDRGPNDILTLQLIDALLQAGAHIVTTISNHDLEFIRTYEETHKAYNELRKQKIDPIQLKQVLSKIIQSPEYSENNQDDLQFEIGLAHLQLESHKLGSEQGASTYAMERSLANGAIQESEVNRLILSYKATSQCLSYSLTKVKDENNEDKTIGISLYMHSTAGLRTVFAIAKKFKLLDYAIVFDKKGDLSVDWLNDFNAENVDKLTAKIEELRQDILTLESDSATTSLREKDLAIKWETFLSESTQAASSGNFKQRLKAYLIILQNLKANGLYALINKEYNTPEKFARLLDKINIKWEEHIKNETVSTLIQSTCLNFDRSLNVNDKMREEFPIVYIAWARNYKNVEYSVRPEKIGNFNCTVIHGHDRHAPNSGYVINLEKDNKLGLHSSSHYHPVVLQDNCRILHSKEVPGRKSDLLHEWQKWQNLSSGLFNFIKMGLGLFTEEQVMKSADKEKANVLSPTLPVAEKLEEKPSFGNN